VGAVSDTPSSVPAGWHADPTGRHQLRYWDGSTWTDHVTDNGHQQQDPLNANLADRIDSALSVGGTPNADQVQQMVSGDGWGGAGIAQPAATGDGTIWGEPVLVVSQKAKLLGLAHEPGELLGEDPEGLLGEGRRHGDAPAGPLAGLVDADLEQVIPAADGHTLPAWRRVIAGLIEHETHHRSQLCEYLRQMGLEPPPLFGLHAEDLPR